MRYFLPLLTVFVCCAFTSKAIAQNTQFNAVPVTLSGSFFKSTNLVPSLHNSYKATDIVGFVYVPGQAGPWVQIPIQVDERDTVDAGKIYNTSTWVDTTWSKGYSSPGNPTAGYYSNFKTLQYCDANTFTGRDRYPAFDPDDELSFMARDMGTEAAPLKTRFPRGVDTASGVEVKSLNVVTQRYYYIYLFNRLPNSGLIPSANRSYITNFVFNFSSNGKSYGPADYKAHYNLFTGPNPESSYITTPYYHRGFADRWIDDTLKIDTNPAGKYINILDKHSFTLRPGSCGRSEYTFSGEDTLDRPSFACNPSTIPVPQSEGAFVTNISGPIRAIRSYMGCNSGPLSQRTHMFYDQMEITYTYTRVHPVSGLVDFYDYNPEAGTMLYNNNNNNPATQPGWVGLSGPKGILIDGVPDYSFKNGPLIWELINSASGTIFRYNFVQTDIPYYTVGSSLPTYYTQTYYLDDYNAQAQAADDGGVTCQCTGDSHSWGACGLYLTPTPNLSIDADFPFSDPRIRDYYIMNSIQVNVYLPSSSPQADTTLWINATKYLANKTAPIVKDWPFAQIANGTFNLYPNPNTGIVNVDVSGTTNNQKITVIFYNITGREIYRLSGIGSLKETIDLHARGGSAQIYIAKIYIGTNIFVRKIIVDK